MAPSSQSLSFRAAPQQFLLLVRELNARAPATVATLTSAVVGWVVTRAYDDYRLWHSLGPSQLPHNFLGWLIHTLLLRPLAMWRGDAFKAKYLPAPNVKDVALLESLPTRKGERPFAAGLAPHRQLSQLTTEKTWRQQIAAYFGSLASAHPSHLRSAFSMLEGRDAPALYAIHPSSAISRSTRSAAIASPLARRYLHGTKGECVHVHNIDGSLHATLSPKDARTVIERGWGELHRLAGFTYLGSWLPRWLGPNLRWGAYPGSDRPGAGKMMPPTYCMIYAPRNSAEFEIVQRICDAAVSFATGLEIRPKAR